MMLAIGRVVIVKGIDKSVNNGTDTAPATVVRSWADTGLVNLKVHLDGEKELWACSVKVFSTVSEASDYVDANPGQLAAHWPEIS